MWGSGLGHGFLMVVGWLLGGAVIGIVVYLAASAALRHRARELRREILDDVLGEGAAEVLEDASKVVAGSGMKGGK